MKKNKILYILLFISSSCFAQNISTSVLQSDNYERVYPESYLDSVNDIWVYPPYTDSKTGKVYEYNHAVSADCNHYTGEYLNYYDDKIEPIGWSKDGRFLFIIHESGYYDNWEEEPEDEDLEGDIEVNKLKTPYRAINLCSGFTIDSDQITAAELKQFPLVINLNSGADTIYVKSEVTVNGQVLNFNSEKKGEILIKKITEPVDLSSGGCPDEVKGYFLSPDKKYLIAVFYSNYRITGAVGDPCEGSIYFKILNLDSFEIIPEKIDFNVVLNDDDIETEERTPCGVLLPKDKQVVQLFLADESINKLELALCLIQDTDNDWLVIQSALNILDVVGTINIEGGYAPMGNNEVWWLEGEMEMAKEMGVEQYFIEKLGLLEDIIFGFTYASYDCGSGYHGGVNINAFITRSKQTAGSADDEFFQLVKAIGCDNGFTYSYGDAFTSQDGLGATPYTFLGDGPFLNYFSKKADFDKYQIQSDTFSHLNKQHTDFVINFLGMKHQKAIGIINSLPSNDLEFHNLHDCLKELNDILEANVLTDSEQEDLKNHIEEFKIYIEKTEP